MNELLLLSTAASEKVTVRAADGSPLPMPVIIIIATMVVAIIIALLVFYLKRNSFDEETETTKDDAASSNENTVEDSEEEEQEDTTTDLDLEAELGAPDDLDEFFFADNEEKITVKESPAAGFFKIPSGSSFTAKGQMYEYFGLSDRFPGKVLGIPAGGNASSSIEVLSMEDITAVENSATNYLAVRDSSGRLLEFTAKGTVSVFDGKSLRGLATAKPYNGVGTFNLAKGTVLRDESGEIGAFVAMDEGEMVIKEGGKYKSIKLEDVKTLTAPALFVEHIPSRNVLIMLQDGTKLRVYDALTGQMMAK